MSRWEFFGPRELACRCGCGLGEADMNPALMAEVVRIRRALGRPLAVASAARCSTHNQRVATTGPRGPHTPLMDTVSGRHVCSAIDVRVFGMAARDVLSLAMERDVVTGIGVAQRGPQGGRFIHLDVLANSMLHPRPWVWSY